MTIEVKQMIIKSTVTNSQQNDDVPVSAVVDVEQLKEQLLEECRELIAETMNDSRER